MDTVAVIGAALDLGAGRRGVDMGPSAIRYAGLAERLEELGRDVIDHGNVPTAIAEATDEGDERARSSPSSVASAMAVGTFPWSMTSRPSSSSRSASPA